MQGDRGYDSEPHRQGLRELGVEPVVAEPQRSGTMPGGDPV